MSNKVSFPYLGHVIVYKKFLQMMGFEVIMPPAPTQKTIDLGVKYSPEFACIPFKMLMGNYIEACELGANTIISSGGHGPCRAGFYGEVHQRILRQMGYDVNFIIFDSPKRDLFGTIKKFFKIKNKQSISKMVKVSKVVFPVLKDLDTFEKKIHTMIPYEINKGQSLEVWREIYKIYDEVYSQKELLEARAEGHRMIDSIKLRKVNDDEKIKIGIVGEIFVVIEPSINMDVENLLCSLGCEAERSLYLSEWVEHNIFGEKHEKTIQDLGEKYIEILIGGHAKTTVGNIVDFKNRGFDGIIHLMPFGCLPELVSQSVIPKITSDHDIPVLTLSIDEQTGKSNNLTRIEAFIDLIRNKKTKEKVFSGGKK
ncbi:MAG: hypothetical protein PWQ77_1545 [Kosmotogales bacterium]|nr:hypothetical protein [Kosmotogales bacterium]